MFRSLNSIFALIVFGFVFLLFCFPGFSRGDNIVKGNVVGFVYDKVGTTPLEGATVKVINILTGAVYESSQSDSFGFFKIEGVEKGLYIYGVKTPGGDFNSDNFFGLRIRENETAKMSISLTPYEGRVTSAIKEVYEEQKKVEEVFVGQVVNYFPVTKIAEIYIIKGLLRLDDKIYIKGETTDFYQDVIYLDFEGSSVKNLFAGQTGFIGVEKKVETGNLIYTVFRKGIFPLLSSPSGNASIIAGSSEIVHPPVEMRDLFLYPSPWKPWGRRRWFCKKYPWHPLCKGYKH